MEKQNDIPLREFQLILLGILKDVADVCRKNNIRFYLGEGSMLGAVRHSGFIPWDDDIDILMYRDDYEKFLEVAPKALGSRYEVQARGLTENFWNVYGQVRLITDDERLCQGYISHLLKNNGPFVDIFPMDYVPKASGAGVSFNSFRIKLYKAMLTYKFKVCAPASPKGKMINILSKLYKSDSLFKKIKKISKKHDKEKLEYTVSYYTTHPIKNQVAPSSCYDEVLEIDFEDTKMPVPKGYDEVLTIIYGDYMTPPKEAQRVQKHSIGSEN